MFLESRNFKTVNINLQGTFICLVELLKGIQIYFNLVIILLYCKDFLNNAWLVKCIHRVSKGLDLFTVGVFLDGCDK